MSQFEESDLVKLTKLCHIECEETEKKKLLHSLQGVLNYVELLKEIDTEGVKAFNHILETMQNVTREDKVGETLPREEFLANAPDHVGGMIRVPLILKY